MRVSVVGVTMELAAGLTIEEFFNYLRDHYDEQEVDFRKYLRTIAIDERGNYRLALFLTIKDHKKFMTRSKDADGKVIIEPREFEEGEQPVDFNFFAIHKDTGAGLYSRYDGSCNLQTFEAFLDGRHAEFQKAQQAERAEELAEEEGLEAPTPKMKKQARNEIKGEFKLVPMIDRTQLDEYLANLDTLKWFEFELDAVGNAKRAFRTLADSVEKTRFRMTFKAGHSVEGLGAAIKEFVTKRDPAHARLGGARQKVRRDFDWFKPSNKEFTSRDFNEISTTIDPTDFDRHVMVVDMIQVMEDNPDIFIEDADDE